MKKYLSVVLLCAAMMFTQSADAQVRFGVKGGLDVSKFSFSENMFDVSNRAGWFIGPTIKLTLPVVGLSVDAAGLYDQRTSKIQLSEASADGTTLKQKSIQVPINLRYGIGLGSAASVFAFAGPQFGFNVGDRDFSNVKDDVTNTFQLKKSTLSVNVGVGFTLSSHLQVTANYNIGIGNTVDATVVDAVNTAVDNLGKTYDGYANSWQVALAYFF